MNVCAWSLPHAFLPRGGLRQRRAQFQNSPAQAMSRPETKTVIDQYLHRDYPSAAMVIQRWRLAGAGYQCQWRDDRAHHRSLRPAVHTFRRRAQKSGLAGQQTLLAKVGIVPAIRAAVGDAGRTVDYFNSAFDERESSATENRNGSLPLAIRCAVDRLPALVRECALCRRCWRAGWRCNICSRQLCG